MGVYKVSDSENPHKVYIFGKDGFLFARKGNKIIKVCGFMETIDDILKEIENIDWTKAKEEPHE
jgi:hypothetical protein